MKLYLVHCGYYDEMGYGLYESHTNLFLAAESIDKAKEIAKAKTVFKEKRMHVDGVYEIEQVDGYQISLVMG